MLTTEELAARFEARRSGDGYLGTCPCHADKKASLSISRGRDGRTLLHCHAGCDIKDILAAKGLTWQDLNPPAQPAHTHPRGEQVACYNYPAVDGSPRLRKIRLRMPDGSKSFYWQHYENGTWNMGRGGMRPGIYHSPGLLANSFVILVEGEKDVDTFTAIGAPFAATLPDGAAADGGKWRPEYAGFFRNRPVLLLPDNDDVGRAFMADIAERLRYISPGVRWMDLHELWPDIPEKADVSDYVQFLHDNEAAAANLGKLAGISRPWDEVRDTLPRPTHEIIDIPPAPGPQPDDIPPDCGTQYDYEAEYASAFDAPADNGSSWPEPKMPERPKMPRFPTDALPDTVGDYVRAVSITMQTAPEMAGTMALGLLAAAFQGRYNVRIAPDWVEPLCLYTVAIAGPGERKSPTMKALLAQAYESERDMQKAGLIAVERSREELNLLLARREAARKAAAKATTPDEAQRWSEQAVDLTAEIACFEPVRPTRWFADDTTPEQLVSMLEEYRGCLTIASAEGGLFATMGGRYEKNGNLDVYLKGHAGDAITVDRVGRSGNSVPDPRLSMMLMIQPTVLQGLMSNAEARGRGLCARFLYAICPSRVGSRDIDPPAIDPAVLQSWRQLMRRLFSAPLPEERTELRLSEAAAVECRRFLAQVEARLSKGWLDIQDWGGKLVGTTMRIAALLHCVQREIPEESEISADTVRAAVRLARFFVPHAMEAYRLMGADSGQSNAEYVLKTLRLCGTPEITRRDLFRKCQARFDRSDTLDATLRYLEELGWVKMHTKETGTRGRNSVYIALHPSLLDKN